MEIKVMDFKQPLESHLGKINKSQENKSTDFTNTFNSVREKTKWNNEDLNKMKQNNKKTRENEEEGSKLIEDLEKEDRVLYENMVNLINIISPAEDDLGNKLEELEVVTSELIPATVVPEESLELNDETTKLIGSHKALEALVQENPKEIVIENLTREENQDIKPSLTGEKLTGIQPKAERENLNEDLAIGGERGLIEVEGLNSDETSKEFHHGSQGEMKNSGTKNDLGDTLENEDNLKLENDFFGPVIKEAIEFPSGESIELDPPIVEPKEVVKQIIDGVKFDLSENQNEMKLTLKPESLGEMTMNIEVAKDGIIAKIMVDNYRTKEIIEENLFQLKEGIKDTGMEIKTFEVFVGNGSDFDQHNFNGSNQFNLKQNSKKLKIKSEDIKDLKNYEDGRVDDRIEPLNSTMEGGLNLFA